MAKQLHLSRPRRGMRDVVRTWLAMRSQRRRRERAALPVLPVAVITSADVVWDDTQQGWADVTFYWSADTSGWSDAHFEVWRYFEGTGYRLVQTVPGSDRVFYQPMATDGEGELPYRVRFRSGDRVGEFSNEYVVVVQA